MYLIEKNMKLTIFSAYVNIYYKLFFYNKQVDFLFCDFWTESIQNNFCIGLSPLRWHGIVWQK